MRQCANVLILPCLALTYFSSAAEKDEAYNLDPRYIVPLTHLLYSPLNTPIALRFINEVMRSETPKLCDTIGHRDVSTNDFSSLFNIVCFKNGSSTHPVALIGVLPVRSIESAVPELTQFEVAKAYSQQLYGLDWRQRIRKYKNLVPVRLILLSQFEIKRVDRPLKHWRMLDIWSHENLYPGFGITSLYLDKCRERVRRDSDVIRNDLDEWCHFFLFAGSYRVREVPTWAKGDGVMELAYRSLDPREYTEPELHAHNQSIVAAENDMAAYEKIVKEGTKPENVRWSHQE